MMMSGGKLSVFWSNGLVASLMALGVALLVSPAVFWLIAKLRASTKDAPSRNGNAAA